MKVYIYDIEVHMYIHNHICTLCVHACTRIYKYILIYILDYIGGTPPDSLTTGPDEGTRIEVEHHQNL